MLNSTQEHDVDINIIIQIKSYHIISCLCMYNPRFDPSSKFNVAYVFINEYNDILRVRGVSVAQS